ncbi:MAG TPA: aminotransferase class III-fold pyridoxal phosphate-dependent enzyme [Streptosporangiaceae bacterium]
MLAEHYGLTAESVTPLGGEVDQNSVADCAGGARVVVKITQPGTDAALLRWQHELTRLAARTPGIPAVPRPLPAADGSTVLAVPPPGEPGLPGKQGSRLVTVQDWVPGVTLSELDRHSPALLAELGGTAARLGAALPRELPRGLASPAHHWDVLRAPEAIASVITAVTDPLRQAQVERITGWFRAAVGPRAARLPRQVVHQDLNDFNVLAAPDAAGFYHVTGVLDFGDAMHTARIAELAVAVAYAMLRKPDPLIAAGHVVRGFHAVTPLTDDELAVLYPMAAARLCVNAVTWTFRHSNGTRPDYASARMRYTWPAIGRLAALPPALAEGWIRDAIGAAGPASRSPAGGTPARGTPAGAVSAWLAGADLSPALPVSPGDADLAGETPAEALADAGGLPVAGRHLGGRRERLARRETETGEPQTVHLGIDLHGAREELRAPLAGTARQSGGHGLLLRHEPADGPVFWSRWSGLASKPAPGARVPAGGRLGVPAGPEPVRVALFTDADAAALAPDWVTPASGPAWARISPDPSPLLGVRRPAAPPWDVHAVTATRRAHLGASQRSYYRRPMNLVTSDDVWLYDESGLGYLDTINNVTHVGHANPAVAAAAARQLRRLNTNSRFVYEGMARYSSRLARLLPGPLEVVFLVCTGSEANDLALRIARQVTGREHIMVIDGAYHGNTTAVTAISPNRYQGPGGHGRPATTREVIKPDRYRGPWGYDDPAAGARYAADVAAVAGELAVQGTPPAAFIAESLMGTAGCVVHPDGYLAAAFGHAKAAGALCISDEVQVGFGRLGESFWGFSGQDVLPDIVTMGKPIGNGHPMAAVVTTREIADAFDTGMKYFNTFGGNPVSCAIGMAVLDEVERRGLQANARATGSYLLGLLRELAERHQLIGDVRGRGLYLGIELVRDRATREPAAAEAAYVCERLKDEGVISYPTGTFDNVLKIKPPMTFSAEHAALFADALDAILTAAW